MNLQSWNCNLELQSKCKRKTIAIWNCNGRHENYDTRENCDSTTLYFCFAIAKSRNCNLDLRWQAWKLRFAISIVKSRNCNLDLWWQAWKLRFAIEIAKLQFRFVIAGMKITIRDKIAIPPCCNFALQSRKFCNLEIAV